jgi:hypothetical protein
VSGLQLICTMVHRLSIFELVAQDLVFRCRILDDILWVIFPLVNHPELRSLVFRPCIYSQRIWHQTAPTEMCIGLYPSESCPCRIVGASSDHWHLCSRSPCRCGLLRKYNKRVHLRLPTATAHSDVRMMRWSPEIGRSLMCFVTTLSVRVSPSRSSPMFARA